VGTIADPAVLGPDYVAQLAQRFPDRAPKVPMLLGAPVVIYPRAALEAGIEGRFAAVVMLDARGRITESRLVVDDPIFGPAVLDALKTMEFAPAEFADGPVPYWAIVEIVFRIGRPDAPSVASTPSRNRPTLPRQPSVGR
jgi:TonB family protein